jgi:hypothetical protein
MNIKIGNIVKIANKPTTFFKKSLTYNNRYSYISPVDKPILSLALRSFH